MTVHLFIPCYVDHFTPQVGQALGSLLDRWQIPWEYPAAQTCCGQFAFNAGEWTTARSLMRHFFQVFRDAETIVCPGASCVRTVRQYYPQLIENSSDAAHLAHLLPRVREFTEWFIDFAPPAQQLLFSGRVFLHQSCAARQLGILPQLRELLGRVANLQVVELNPAYSCCGFGGLFAAKRPDLAQAIGWNYLAAIRDTGAETVVSPDVGCLLHLQGILTARQQVLPMYHLVEFIGRAGQDC